MGASRSRFWIASASPSLAAAAIMSTAAFGGCIFRSASHSSRHSRSIAAVSEALRSAASLAARSAFACSSAYRLGPANALPNMAFSPDVRSRMAALTTSSTARASRFFGSARTTAVRSALASSSWPSLLPAIPRRKRAFAFDGSSLSAALAAATAGSHCSSLTQHAARLEWSEARSGDAVSGASLLAAKKSFSAFFAASPVSLSTASR